MKQYDFKKAKALIKESAEALESASLGMHEDWFWTADTVWINGKYKKALNKNTKIGGINASIWATPTLCLYFKDGSEKMIEVSLGENEQQESPFAGIGLGALSAPVQENITPLTK